MDRLSLGQCIGVITFCSPVWRYIILFANRNKYLGGPSEPGPVLWRDYGSALLFGGIYIILLANRNEYLGGSSEPGPVLWRDYVPLTRLAVYHIISQLEQISGWVV